jgi:thymidine kinase
MFNTDVDSIVKGLNKTVEKLVKLAEKKNGEIAVTADKIAELSDHCDCCRDEAVRASRIAEKISELVA